MGGGGVDRMECETEKGEVKARWGGGDTAEGSWRLQEVQRGG